jgi:Secretion system C-terminal sorting domain/Cleaved Adhesin Domain
MKKRMLFFLLVFSLFAGGFRISIAQQVSRSSSVVINVIQQNQPMRGIYIMDFESVADFSLSFPPWTVNDMDGDSTYRIESHTFPHDLDPKAFIAFNPAMVTPPMTDAGIQPHSGNRFGACFSSFFGANNDWFISPGIQLKNNGEFSFWEKAYTNAYGAEKYKVGISTTTNDPSSFVFISGNLPLNADTFWTKKSFNLSAYNNQQVYLAIQCVSNNAFIFMIDDLEVNTGDTTVQLPSSAKLDFENIPDFSLIFNPWTVNDVKGGITYGIDSCTFPHNGSPMAFICFNPSKAAPPPLNMSAHSGDKFGACFSSQPPKNPNNKWLISPRMQPGNNAKIALWVQSYNLLYGYEKFNIGVSITGNDPSDFTIISGPKPDSAPASWVHKTYSLTNYTNQPVYIGIQCVTNNGFCFMVDDIEIGSSVNIDNNLQNIGLSVYPNPARDKIYIDFGDLTPNNLKIEIYDMTGKIVWKYETEERTGTIIVADISGLDPGIYLLKINDSHGNISRKLIVEK